MKKIAVLILAAGKASRFGSEKLLQVLPNGLTLIRHITAIAAETGLSPVIVVTPAVDQAIQEALAGFNVNFAINHSAHLGISTSLQTGIQQIPKDYDAALVVLGDQPFISNKLLKLLIDRYENSAAEIVYPTVDEKRSNPVILDRDTFSAVMDLRGDIGARAIFPNFRCQAVDWPDSRLLLDVDSPQDLDRIITEWDL